MKTQDAASSAPTNSSPCGSSLSVAPQNWGGGASDAALQEQELRCRILNQTLNPASGKGRCGFTLVEVVVATGLTLLLFFGAMTVYVASARLTLATGAACYATTDAANAVQQTVRQAEEASWLALPGEPSWTSPGGASVAAFQATSQGAVISTGVELVFPATAAASVQSSGGAALPVTPIPYSRSLNPDGSDYLWIYRADKGGAPNPSSGAYLWMAGMRQGQSISQVMTGSLSPNAVNAVQFSRPVTASSPVTALPYQLQIKLVSAYYASVSQTQTSELTTQGTNPSDALTVGKCALLRDHELNNDHEPGSGAVYGAANASLWQSD